MKYLRVKGYLKCFVILLVIAVNVVLPISAFAAGTAVVTVVAPAQVVTTRNQFTVTVLV